MSHIKYECRENRFSLEKQIHMISIIGDVWVLGVQSQSEYWKKKFVSDHIRLCPSTALISSHDTDTLIHTHDSKANDYGLLVVCLQYKIIYFLLDFE